MSISSAIKSLQDIMRKDAGVDGDAQRLGQLSWLLFLKIFDAQEQALEIEQEKYRLPMPERYLWRNWAADNEGITGDKLLAFVNDDLFPTLKDLPAQIDINPRGYVVKQAFSDAYNYMKNGTLLRQVINKLNEIDFTRTSERHLFGDIYEQILRDLQAAGNAGEFYTPRAVTRFMVERVDPKLGESIMDPACGTGGFLACAFDHVKNHYAHTVTDHQILQKQIHGVEKKQLPHLLCTTNMLLHGIEVPVQIRHDNTLNKPLSSWDEQMDVIITNPPFGGTEEDGIEKNFPSDMQTRETADLFLQLIIEVLAKNGRAAVVLPDGTLFGEGVKTKIKKLLTEECNLHTIVRLPNGVFNPYTGIKTNLLFFTKGQPTKEIWFYEHPHPAGVKNYSKTKPMKFEEFQAEIDWWGNEADGFASRVENEQAWKVSIDEVIARNFNLDIKNPHQAETVSHDPDELLAQYAKQQEEIQTLRHQLRDILGAALSGKEAN
ncbi:N-6 DNA methylase [Salmonella sp. AM017]|nr:SAM-dependent DNA methyltransferase [Salmonella enterica subsp. enterica serovar Newport]EAX7861157.1 SAM-dependent DNA methyltransferase [Salmonella enterica]EBS3379011.1 SAM-dependent DNA methyltransferase [Salmonella enterica subsp. enterica serovar Newport]EBW7986055.1 SAM-dependent DNA methyltransferase [Salmonella enterica subsp. enterica serovar Newport]EBZ2067638.1 SAM-dependent DNA methyltransferase [Salmonella enterica subsp. enterica serovar Newport]